MIRPDIAEAMEIARRMADLEYDDADKVIRMANYVQTHEFKGIAQAFQFAAMPSGVMAYNDLDQPSCCAVGQSTARGGGRHLCTPSSDPWLTPSLYRAWLRTLDLSGAWPSHVDASAAVGITQRCGPGQLKHAEGFRCCAGRPSRALQCNDPLTNHGSCQDKDIDMVILGCRAQAEPNH